MGLCERSRTYLLVAWSVLRELITPLLWQVKGERVEGHDLAEADGENGLGLELGFEQEE
jgi:hypothetical protein